MKNIIFLLIGTILVNCNSSAQKIEKKEIKVHAVSKTDSTWKSELSDMEYFVLRKAGTEHRFSSPLNKNYKKGIYVCTACNTPLFKSEHKFDSGSGWPSFYKEIKGNVAFSTDHDLGYTRTEAHCATCGGHLGHVFNDGPKDKTGKRHCVNGVALTFIPKK